MEAEPGSLGSREGGSSAAVAEPVVVPAAFHYSDINVLSIDGIIPHLKIPGSIPLFQMHPTLKSIVRLAVTHAIKELIGQFFYTDFFQTNS